MNSTQTETRIVYNNIMWALRCWKRDVVRGSESRYFWARELAQFRRNYETVFMAANASFWAVNENL